MTRLQKPFLKLPNVFIQLGNSLDKNKFPSVNLYFQDESRFGLMSHIGRCITAKGVRPVISYQHRFSTTYLYGSYSPIDGNSFVWEINGTSIDIFKRYLQAFSAQRPNEYKIVVIDNARFHLIKPDEVPENIFLLNIPPYTPELNPSEQIWQYIKTRYKNQLFATMRDLKKWLWDMVIKMQPETIMSITGNKHYLKLFNAAFCI
ncbi:IS630 family transposase [Maribellus comscasis]|uniref:IS630 family transposase n=1 Tax=Maribellus comscasis TaxID=2681766 RepID=A0A6I6KBN7_9BACT|nr:IS630 family transposase [Maribellus comscasis]QGY47654.1 IS630 family transposase [Maribellus comscasis]